MDIQKANINFWEELCGTSLAKSLGINDHTIDAIIKFDDAYLDIYPYLLDFIRVDQMESKRVLEIGLGYGTLGQKIVEAGAVYTGMDVANAPVRMMRHRLKINDLSGDVTQGSALNMPFPSEYFDFVISIGCFHHTGDAQGCVDETYRVLKQNGVAVIMVYNQFSYRMWMRWPCRTFINLLSDAGFMSRKKISIAAQRKAYDADSDGNAAPETAFFSVKKIHNIFSKFKALIVCKKNCDPIGIMGFNFISRKRLLPVLGKTMGLDLYIRAEK